MKRIIFAICVTMAIACNGLYKDLYDKSEDFENAVILFATDSQHSGDLGGRRGADEICRRTFENNYSVAGIKIHAFLSFNIKDQINKMPDNYNVPGNVSVKSLSGVLIDDSFDGLFDLNGIQNSMHDAGVVDAPYATGSLGNGNVDGANNCNGFTSSVPGDKTQKGYADKTDHSWLDGETAACANDRFFLCIAYH